MLPAVNNIIRYTILILACYLLNPFQANAQLETPKWKASKVQTSITPYLWLPWISGSLQIDGVLKDFEPGISATPIDLLRNIRGTAMIHGQVSKGPFVADVDYMFLLLKAEKTLFENESGDDVLLSEATLKGHIVEFTVGGRIQTGIIIFDPYAGMRYTFLRTEADLSTTNRSRDAAANISFFDALIGARLTIFPHPRVPLSIQGDIGGLGGVSRITYAAEVKAGYRVSKLVDLFMGFKAWGFEYKKNDTNRSMGIDFYGLELGATFNIPKLQDFSRSGSGSPVE